MLRLMLILLVVNGQLGKNTPPNFSENLWKTFQLNNRPTKISESQFSFTNISRDISMIQSSLLRTDLPDLDEQPFDMDANPPTEQMLQLFRLENYKSDLLRIFKPRESLLFPQGRVQIVPHYLIGKSSDRKWIFNRYLSLFYEENVKNHFGKQKRREMRKFLKSFNYCPVHYKWVDKGIRFWPRWIKEGHCVNIHGSCSIPSGMFCHEDNHETVMLFRYICLKSWMKENCKWYKMHIPIVTSCRCSCD